MSSLDLRGQEWLLRADLTPCPTSQWRPPGAELTMPPEAAIGRNCPQQISTLIGTIGELG